MGWQANPYGGSRECPIIVAFEVVYGESGCDSPPEPAIPLERLDLQHLILRAKSVGTCDMPATITRKRRFLIF
jgi:hypothetical protein